RRARGKSSTSGHEGHRSLGKIIMRTPNTRVSTLSCVYETSCLPRGLRHLAAVAAGLFEQRKKIGHAEEGPEGLADVREFQLASFRAARNVQGHESSQAGAVHERHVF